MPRRLSKIDEQDRGQAEYGGTRRGSEYPGDYSGTYGVEKSYPGRQKVKRNRNRQSLAEGDYEDLSKGEEERKREFNGQYPLADDDPNDYESYSYKYKNHTYLKSSGESGDDIRHRRKERRPSLERQWHSRTSRRPSKYEREYTSDELHDRGGGKAGRAIKDLHPSDRAVLDHAATKIQAAYKGYRTRKSFWKKMEHQRRQSLRNMKQYREDDYTIGSATSIVNDARVDPRSLAINADPNVGLTPSIPSLDNSQRHNILRDLKNTFSYSDDISVVSQLQTESSPNIVVLGGINPAQAKDYVLGASIFVYNIQKDQWFFGGVMPEPRNYHTAAYLNGKIYIIGGYSPLETFQKKMLATATTYQLSVRSKRWRKRANMHHGRACHGMSVVNGNIIVLGGRDESGKLRATVEMYYPKRDQWVLLKSMPEAMMGLSCTVLDGCVFAIGGIVNEGNEYTVSDRTYAFDFEKQMWYKAPSLPEPRAFSCAATLKREIWLWCGVRDDVNEDDSLISTNSVLVYNSELSKWAQHTTIATSKHAAAVAKCGRRVHILGGISSAPGSKEVLDENDLYNGETDKYIEGACLPRPLAGCAAVSLPIHYVATSDPKWNSEDVDEEVMNKAATKIQAAYRGYRTRSIISDQRDSDYPYTDMRRNNRGDAIVMRASVHEAFSTDKFKDFQRVQIEDWPPIPDLQVSNSDVNLRYGTLPRGYTITKTNTRSKVKRYVLLPSHADPNLSMMGHLCNVYKRAKTVLGLRRVERLPEFASNLLTAPILQDDCIPVVLVMGGLQPKDPVNLAYGKQMLRYHTLKNRWEYFGALPEPRNYHAAVYYEENIYVSGGCDPDLRNSGEMVSTSTFYCLNIHSSDWIEKAEMNCCRAYHGLVAALGKIFAIGGRDNNGRLIASIEVYDIENDKWSMLRPMNQPRMGMACAVVDDHIWCVGGIGVQEPSDNSPYPVLSSVISYDIGKDSWMTRPPLRCPRAFGSCVIVDDTMWLVGGASKDHSHEMLISMASVDKYYPVEAEWERKTLLSNPRHCAAVLAIDSCIYIFGGVSSQEWCPLARNEMIICDDISLHTCEPLPVPLTGLAAVAIPPVVPSLRSESFALLLHTKLTYH